MATHMWKFCCKNIHRSHAYVNTIVRRTLLSEAYSCNEAWRERLSTPLLSQVVADDFCLRLNEKFEKESRVNAIDIDILMNKLTDLKVVDLDFVETILHKFRHTQDALKVLDSTHHAVIREYLQMKKADRLLPMIQDKLGYGIFPDVYSANLLMDHFIKTHNFSAASRIACELMLQETVNHPTTNLLVLYACLMRVNELPAATDAQNAEEQEVAGDADEEEMQYIPIKYVRNPWYDDHFDITSEQFLLGKTLAAAARQHKNILGTSLELIGWGLYNKFENGLELLREVKTSDTMTVAEEALASFTTSLEEAAVKTEDITQEHGMQTLEDERLNARMTEEEKSAFQTELKVIATELSECSKICDDDLQKTLSALIEIQLPDLEEADISEQKQLFKKWDMKRQEELDIQIKKYLIYQKRKIIDEKLQELREKEELLNYFDRQDEIEVAQLNAPPVEEIAVTNLDEDDELDKKAKRKRR